MSGGVLILSPLPGAMFGSGWALCHRIAFRRGTRAGLILPVWLGGGLAGLIIGAIRLRLRR